jgi:hypothetical protein
MTISNQYKIYFRSKINIYICLTKGTNNVHYIDKTEAGLGSSLPMGAGSRKHQLVFTSDFGLH